jgi:hypothetical protein
MTHTSTPLEHIQHHNPCYADCGNKKIFSLPFCQEDILQLQEIFVTCGIHRIQAKNVADGRKVIQTILHSLNYFHNIGSITQAAGLPNFVCDVIRHVEFDAYHNQQPKDLYAYLEQFLTVHPCFDFMWVELSVSMQQQYSLASITKMFEMYHVQERMPVVIVTYEEE